MSRKEVPRAGLVKASLAGKVTNQEGARALGVSVRQFKRLKARFRREGARGLVHRRRGQPSRRRCPAALREQIVQLMTTTYAGFNDVHLTEKLQELHALPVSRATVRRIRLALGRASPRRRRAPQHRSRRPRAPAMGQLVQLDASPFAWFEDRGPRATLHGLIDDATSSPLALWFRPTEDLHGYTTVLGQTCRQYGLPITLYGDRLNLFRRNDQHWTLPEELRASRIPPISAACCRSSASASSPRSRRKPRAASNACGARSRTAWSANSASARWRRSSKPTSFCPRSSPASSSASPAPRRSSRRPGARRRVSWRTS